MSFKQFKDICNLDPIDLQSKINLMIQLRGMLDKFNPNSITPEIETAADQLLFLSEELLLRSIQPNLELLRNCNVDTETLLKKLEAIDSGEKIIIAIDSDLDNKILIQIERLILSKIKVNIRNYYQIGCIIKLAIILSDGGRHSRSAAEAFLKERKQFFMSILDEEGELFIQDLFDKLPRQFENYGVEEFNSEAGKEPLEVKCPCCGQLRKCEPFSDVAQLVMISIPGRIPYQGILFCIECKSFRCGVNASWVIFTGREKELSEMKRRGMLPDNACFYTAKCGKSGCEGHLYSLPEDALFKLRNYNG